MSASENGAVLRLIAVLKVLKAVTLVAAGVGLLTLLHGDVGEELTRWVTRLGLDPGNRWVSSALEKATHLSSNKIRDLGVASFSYAGLFLTEGVGLWLLKRWAEWFTIFITASLIPVEVYEIMHHPTATKVAVLAINMTVMGYLLYRIRTEGSRSNDGNQTRAPEKRSAKTEE